MQNNPLCVCLHVRLSHALNNVLFASSFCACLQDLNLQKKLMILFIFWLKFAEIGILRGLFSKSIKNSWRWLKTKKCTAMQKNRNFMSCKTRNLALKTFGGDFNAGIITLISKSNVKKNYWARKKIDRLDMNILVHFFWWFQRQLFV